MAERSLTKVEIAAILALLMAVGLLAPAMHRTLWEAALLVPLAGYNLWVSRSRGGAALLGAALILLALAILLPSPVPAGPPPP